ncbi:hypothetical protein DEO72_LG3g1602 [Vigna unguiculata]|uniref:Uncharacterized protein n=1 Tax=Vigna unguiculata TaxID=3917 RepID=A0A4D6LEN3_VIGUN|nr:hypothetical protein DEO72_LG3g1602 [Vigna unguiculata]
MCVKHQVVSGAELDCVKDSTQLWMEVLRRCFAGGLITSVACIGSKEAKEKPCEIDEASWRRMKVRKLEDERRSGAAMVFGEALNFRLAMCVKHQVVSGAELDCVKDSTQLWMEVLRRCFAGGLITSVACIGSKEAKEKPCEIDEASWRRMKVRKLEDERRSGAAMVFGEALK